MAKLAFTGHLKAVAPTGVTTWPGATVAEVLAGVFAAHPLLEHYVLDEQGRVRKHVTLFVDGVQQPKSRGLEAPVGPDTEIFVLQALSGG